MPLPTAISDLSQTAASNYPAGSDSPNVLDDVDRAHASFIALLRDGKGFTDPVQLASGATTDIGGQNALFVEITGTTTITSFSTNYNGPRFLRFTGALTLTHNATTLNLPGAANIATAAGDCCIAIPNQAGNGWNVVQYQHTTAGNGHAFSAVPSAATSLTSATAVKVTFGTEVYDYGSGYDPSTSRFTPNVAGIYRIGASVRLATSATTLALYVYKNGVLNKEIGSVAQGVNQQSSGWAEISLNGSTDYVEIYVTQGAATQNNITNPENTWFQGSLVRPI